MNIDNNNINCQFAFGRITLTSSIGWVVVVRFWVSHKKQKLVKK